MIYPAAVAALALGAASAAAWDTPHHPPLLARSLHELGPAARHTLTTRLRAPSAEEQARTLARLRQELELNPAAPVPLLYPGEELTVQQVLLANTAAEPDGWGGALGMDQELPESADPLGERAHMGGTKGGTSQGFRHMYFGGWQWRAPLATFQIPPHAIGQAPERIEKLTALARQLLGEGQDLWAWRLIGWATHYAQDLAQPFHSTQIVHWRMIPWSSLLAWPPGEAFGALTRAATHSVSNYHLAYEKYVFARAAQFGDCLGPRRFETAASRPLEPREIGLKIAERSRAVAPELGRALIQFFGEGLRDPAIDIGKDVGVPDFGELERRADLAVARQSARDATCEALSWGVAGSAALIEWLARTPPRR